MSLMTRDQLLRTTSFKTKDLTLDGWGDIRIRELTARQLMVLNRLDKSDQEEAGRLYSRLAAMSLIDGENELLFDADNDIDIDLLQNKPWSCLEALSAAVISYNGFGEKDVEGKAKN